MLSPNELLCGKDLTERIVSVEIENDEVVIFQEDLSGKILKHKRPYQTFVLASNKLDFGFEQLEGDLHFKYLKECSESNQYQKLRREYKEAWGVISEKESYLIYTGVTYYKNMLFEDVSVVSIDIETTGLMSDEDKQVLIISNAFRKKGKIEKKIFALDEYESEEEMILAWVEWIKIKDPSIITGYNLYGFDLPYIVESLKKFNKTLNLGRDGSALWFRNEDFKPEKFKPDNSQYIEFYPAFIYGREIVDAYFLAKKYDIGKNYPNYKLKSVIEYEGLVQEGRQFYEADKIKDNWSNLDERKKIKQYCIDDAIDALNIYDLAAPAFFYNAPFVPKPFNEIVNKSTGSQINNILLRAYLSIKNSIPRAHYNTEFEGAISFGNSGTYKNVLKVDVESLYPSIIRHFKIYDDIKDPNAYLLKIVDYFTKERLKNKDKAKRTNDKYFSSLEKSQKLMINSIFGMLGTKGLFYNSPDKASDITEKGRAILRKAVEWAKNKELVVANADTDSISFAYKDGKFIDEDERIVLIKSLNEEYPALINWTNDGYYDGMIVLKAKNYVLYNGRDIVLKGSALRSSNKEPALKEMLLSVVKLSLGLDSSTETVTDIYLKYINEIVNLKNIDRWAIQKTMSDKIFKAVRPAEQKIFAAVEEEHLSQGEKFLVYYDKDNNLKLTRDFDNDHDADKLFEKTYKTIQVFSEILDTSACLNYKLKRNKKNLSLLP